MSFTDDGALNIARTIHGIVGASPSADVTDVEVVPGAKFPSAGFSITLLDGTSYWILVAPRDAGGGT